jgi:uncharacterized protein YdaU (DUF1376 family)
MAKPWMPIYWGDYLRDTQDLTTLQHGMYLLLIAHYWQHDGLPDDEAKLARISKTSLYQWRSNCLAIASMFLPGWKHKRIEAELEKHRTISEKRAFAGRKGGESNGQKNNVQRMVGKAIAKQRDDIPHKYITSTEIGTAREEEAERRRQEAIDRMRQRQSVRQVLR